MTDSTNDSTATHALRTAIVESGYCDMPNLVGVNGFEAVRGTGWTTNGCAGARDAAPKDEPPKGDPPNGADEYMLHDLTTDRNYKPRIRRTKCTQDTLSRSFTQLRIYF